MMTWLIRPGNDADVPAVKRLEDATFDYDRLSVRSLQQAMRSQTQEILVAVDCGDVLAGYLLLHFRARTRSCRIYSIAVERGYSRRGLGARLLGVAEDRARLRDCDRISLEVRKDQCGVQKFYEQHGFSAINTVADYYDDGATAVRYCKSLK